MWHAYWSSSSFLQNIIKICLRVSKLWSVQDFVFREDNYITKKKVRVLSCMWHAWVLLFISTKYYNIISMSMGVMACTRFLLQGRQLHKKESCLSCTRYAYWSSSSSLQNIIKLSQTVWELWPAQAFGFRGDNYITKTVRVVTLARNIPTGPLLHFYQTLSKYVFGYQSYGLHKISTSGEITTQRIKWELSLLHATHPLVLLFIPTKIFSNYLKQYGSCGLHKISASGEVTI